MERREFLIGSAVAAVGGGLHLAGVSQGNARATQTYRVLGVPLRSGSLYPGNENDAQAYRNVDFVERLQSAGVKASDEGDVAIPSYLPHHSVPPIRSWPGPRIAWECVGERVAPYLRRGEVPLLIGCDCSVVVGTTQAMMQVAGAENVHVLYVDGDFDDAPPEAGQTNSAASMGVWLLTHASPFWTGPVLKGSQVTVVGWTNPSRAGGPGVKAISREEVERMGARTAAQKALDGIPASASVLVHFDIDVMRASEMPAAYFPHAEGLGLSQTSELMNVLLKDSRVRLIEVSEYAMLRDADAKQINELAEVLIGGLKTAG